MYWLEHSGDDSYAIYKLQNSVQTQIGKSDSGIAANDDIIKILLNGPLINVYVNDTFRAYATDSSIKGTKFGIGNWCNKEGWAVLSL